jgi:hypothetical protein
LYINIKSGYAILSVDEAHDDRLIYDLLIGQGITGIISESTQYIVIDDFGTPKIIPLDSFHNEIEPFDPRDDGYASKLRSFFVNNGSRFFFIPLEENHVSANLEKKITLALEDTPFSLTLPGQGKSYLNIFHFLLAAALIAALYFSRSRRHFILLTPLLFSIGWAGFPAMILAAIYAGMWELIREPQKELIAAYYYRKNIWEQLKPFMLNFALFFLLLIFLLVLPGIGLFRPITVFLMTFCFIIICVLYISLETARLRKNRHIPFTPVSLIPKKLRSFSLFPLFIPFGLVSICALLIPYDNSMKHNTLEYFDTRFTISPNDYYGHLSFQRGFSYRPLSHGSSIESVDNITEGAYNRYYLGDDGLIAGVVAYASSGFGNWALEPSFPLEKLMGYLLNYYDPMEMVMDQNYEPKTEGLPAEWIFTAALLLLGILDMLLYTAKPGLKHKSSKRVLEFRDKRMAA